MVIGCVVFVLLFEKKKVNFRLSLAVVSNWNHNGFISMFAGNFSGADMYNMYSAWQ